MFAIEITRQSVDIIRLLNNGVAPLLERKKKTYFVFDATWNSDFVPEILIFKDLANRFDIKSVSPFVLCLKEI